MATEKAALRVTELDFLSIRENLKTFLRSQSEFQDFDFDGSGMSILLEILSYNTHYMAYYLNMVGNEMFLDTAQIRNSVLSHAKLMNYVPASKQGALSKIDILVTPSNTEDNDATSVTLEKYTRLLGYDKNGINYPFVTLNSNTALKTNGTFSFSNVYIKQGEVITLQYLVDSTNEKRRFEIPSANVDTTSVIVSVQESSSNTDTKVYTLAEDIVELTGNSTVYFIEENENLNYSFYFGDNFLGKRPKDGNIVICTYLDNVGEQSNNITGFTFTDQIGGEYRDNVIISSAISSYGGSDKETIEQVRFRAPYFYTTQNRAVTKNDYETLLLKDYNFIDSLSVWGGEDNEPVVYGKVYVSIKTKGNYQLTNFEKEQIKDDLIQSRNVLTVTPEIVDPEYVYIIIEGSVTYDSKATSKTAGELEQLVKAAISDYNDEELSDFISTFRKSKLQTYIENCDPSITGSDIDIYVQKRVPMLLNSTRTYNIQYKMPIRQLPHENKLSTYPEIEVYDASGVSRNVFIEEVPEAETGIERIDILDSGINYINAPTVTIKGDGRGATATARVVGGRLFAIDVTNVGSDYSNAIVELTGGDGYGASAVAILQSKIGILRTYYYKTNGEKVIVNSNAGTVNYSTGTITLDSIKVFSVMENDFYDDDTLTFKIQADEDIIKPLRNRILVIDDADAKSKQITMIAE